jgi:hypothetical protein
MERIGREAEKRSAVPECEPKTAEQKHRLGGVRLVSAIGRLREHRVTTHCAGAEPATFFPALRRMFGRPLDVPCSFRQPNGPGARPRMGGADDRPGPARWPRLDRRKTRYTERTLDCRIFRKRTGDANFSHDALRSCPGRGQHSRQGRYARRSLSAKRDALGHHLWATRCLFGRAPAVDRPLLQAEYVLHCTPLPPTTLPALRCSRLPVTFPPLSLAAPSC